MVKMSSGQKVFTIGIRFILIEELSLLVLFLQLNKPKERVK